MFKKLFKRKHREDPQEFKIDLKNVEGMSQEEYLKYYIKVLEKQIDEAGKILKQKKVELKKLEKSL